MFENAVQNMGQQQEDDRISLLEGSTENSDQNTKIGQGESLQKKERIMKDVYFTITGMNYYYYGRE